MSEDKKDFKVSDRRHFTPEGEARGPQEEDVRPAAPPPPEPAAPPPPLHAPEPPPPSESQPAFGAGHEDPEGSEPLPADLIGLLVSLGAQASFLLSGGRTEHGEQEPDLDGARAVITLLEVLKAKTQGNRTPDEDSVLDGILYELRMAYLARSRKGP
jgi:hypothetical protein